jgi:hypothetical protein
MCHFKPRQTKVKTLKEQPYAFWAPVVYALKNSGLYMGCLCDDDL